MSAHNEETTYATLKGLQVGHEVGLRYTWI